MRGSAPPRICVITEGRDELAEAVVSALRARGVGALPIAAERLVDCSLLLDAESCTVDGFRVAGVLFRASLDSSWSEGFVAEDRPYCDAELRAAWLAILNLDSVLAINRLDATAWFEGGGWPTWRRLLFTSGVPVSPFSFGAVSDPAAVHASHWHPYRGGARAPVPGTASRRFLGTAVTAATDRGQSLLVCGEVIAGAKAPVRDAIDALEAYGLRLASIATDEEGRVLSVNARPTPNGPELVRRTASTLAEAYVSHLRSW